MNWHPQAYQPLLDGHYQQVAEFYEQLIENEPEALSYYWYLGLAYLLQEQEEDAQMTWLLPMSQGTPEETQQWSQDLIAILDTEAHRQQAQENYQLSWLLRAHIQQIDPTWLENLFHLIELEILLDRFQPKILDEWQVVELVQENPQGSVNTEFLLQVLAKALKFPNRRIAKLTEAISSYITNPEAIIKTVMPLVPNIAYERKFPEFAADLTRICLKLKPERLDILDQLFWYLLAAKQYSEALAVAHQFYEQVNSLDLKVYGNYKIFYILLHRGAWQNIDVIANRHKELMQKLLDTQPKSIDPLISDFLQGITMPLLYLQDNPGENRFFINQVGELFQRNLQNQFSATVNQNTFIKADQPRKLKIGYIGHTFRKHSVGWLGRWLLQHHNREAFEIVIYIVKQPEDELTQWYKNKADLAHSFSATPQAIAKQIQQDEIDILVDLDSLTNNISCQVMALKPAPIQVSWLGLDASGIPAIDYYIADPYVLPEDAQNYYREKIWRLPNTYLAVDGFEIAVPTLRREHLDIPDDAVTYMSGQSGLKRHPDTIRLQMQIIKAVPNSYLLLKGTGDEQIIQELFIHLAQEQQLSPDRLRFLPQAPTEEIHRANLAIADVVLDTYPYNGATTTLEVLWMGIPLVTRVGQQFAARNSYTFMVNTGVEEGIAWNDEEYIEWGIRLGTDEKLRQQIAWKLRQSRKTAPLWNAQQFTRDMEKAYQQMWAKFNS